MLPKAPEELPKANAIILSYPMEHSFVTEKGKRIPVLHSKLVAEAEMKPRHPNPPHHQALCSAWFSESEEEEDPPTLEGTVD